MAFQLSPEQLQFLLSPRGEDWLAKAAQLPLTSALRLADVQGLRQHLSATETAALVEQILLRRRGLKKFERAGQMLFLREALEQATDSVVAAHRARRFHGLACVLDLGCGIGGDTIFLAQAAETVIGLDLDPLRLKFARHNCAVYNLGRKTGFIQANSLNAPATPTRIDAVFADPARRSSAGKRAFDPKQYHPPLDKLTATYARQAAGIKVAPGLNFNALPNEAEVEIVSLAGEAKEATLWLNVLATPGISRRATLLPGGETLTNLVDAACPTSDLGAYLYEPDPAVIRAGLVKQLANQLNLHLIDERIAYLSGNAPIESPFVKGYKIETQLPLKLKQINRYLKAHNISRVNVKQRGTGLKPEAVFAQLKPAKKGVERTIILLRFQNRHRALVCKRLTSITF